MILSLVEIDPNGLTEASQQMLTFARNLVTGADDLLAALVIGAEDTSAIAGELAKYGVQKILTAENEMVKDYAPVAWAKIVTQAISESSPRIVAAPGTDRGNEVMAHLGAIMGLPMAANCSAVSKEDPSQVTRLRWGSSLLEEAIIKGEPYLITVGQHIIEAEELPSPVECTVDKLSLSLDEKDFQVRVVRLESDDAEGITLKTASVVVGGGRGVGSPEAYSVLEELAGEIGAAVGCTRVATNNGWRPHSDQVGLTGTRISPDLYIACGISGAIQHLVGCKGAKNVLVINKDPEAAFFAKADYGIIGDLHEVLPAITEELKKVKA